MGCFAFAGFISIKDSHESVLRVGSNPSRILSSIFNAVISTYGKYQGIASPGKKVSSERRKRVSGRTFFFSFDFTRRKRRSQTFSLETSSERRIPQNKIRR
ncbi:UNVERIFIED_CONTAM: hypothetical protein RMT77_013261 [Armadillidium vulgare]